MPNGKTHTNINLSFFVPSVVACMATSTYSEMKYYFVGYLFSTLFCNPDNDLKNNSAEENWGKLQYIWRPYAKLFKHRGISHKFFTGTLTRVIYLILMGLVIYYLGNVVILERVPVFPMNFFRYGHFWYQFIVGMAIADACHILLDRYFQEGRCSLKFKDK